MDMEWRGGRITRWRDTTRHFLFAFVSCALAGALGLGASDARAQSGAYPARPSSFVVAYTPGSANDILARIVAPEVAAALGQNVIVENKPGAGGSIGVAAVARARNDGYTFGLVSTSTMAINPAMYRNVPYDPKKDFALVIKLASTPTVLAVPAQSPATSVQDLMRRMASKEKTYQYGSPGAGTAQHLEAALMAKIAGASADHVPYRGPAEQLTALVAGQVDFGFFALPAVLGYIKDGRLRALGITTLAPVDLLPNVPSLSTAGLDGFEKTGIWWGVVLPAGTPDATVQTLHRSFEKALAKPATQSRLIAAGYDPAPAAPASEFTQFVSDQIGFWADVVKTTGASID
ncbi:MAG: tripartite tricarboxylate transporter substrate-binding protein [Proteobacteria bacterium]|nr:tripartite tricarboxylate transporter substrate-binding protein [Pseudomonadota bacterium]